MKMREDEFITKLKERNHIFKDGHDALDIARHVLMILQEHDMEYAETATILNMGHIIYYLNNYKFRYEI